MRPFYTPRIIASKCPRTSLISAQYKRLNTSSSK